MLKREWDKSVKRKEDAGIIKSAATGLLATRAMLRMSPFLPSYISKLSPENFLAKTTKFIESMNLKKTKIEGKIEKLTPNE